MITSLLGLAGSNLLHAAITSLLIISTHNFSLLLYECSEGYRHVSFISVPLLSSTSEVDVYFLYNWENYRCMLFYNEREPAEKETNKCVSFSLELLRNANYP